MSTKAKVLVARAVSGRVSTAAHPEEERQSWFYQTESSGSLGNL